MIPASAPVRLPEAGLRPCLWGLVEPLSSYHQSDKELLQGLALPLITDSVFRKFVTNGTEK